ncbi:FG-GAP repeat domain-containing protein [Chryseolinea lacunae]|uniref:VCBS repeat-containing protein n=1 Tax=Chryseolinea lacunae TaxID=2801331 RepID=A0ABS1KU64_9BACT|nr:VCBS repeat-containing protein [Chryseolinea lacunae]MBL0742738.1 VCBS repeat-containing protein [Chryseolinea lacunae]
MKILFFSICLASTIAHNVVAQTNRSAADQQHEKKKNHGNEFPNFDRSLPLEDRVDTTANVSFGDFDGDGHLDLLLVKGRHWPIVDRVLLGDGKGGIRKAHDLGKVADRSYTGGVADFNEDGFPDIAISNDDPDRKLIYVNDGKGNFNVASEFGRPEWPTRNLSIADVNGDHRPDLILANRGNRQNTSNYVCLNNGKGQFDAPCMAFAPYPATTIYATDMNNDGLIDLLVPHRDGGQSYAYLGNADHTFADTHRIPFGPPNATIRQAAAADFNGDGLPDIVTIDEKKGVNLYLGQNNKTFSEGISLANATTVPYALTLAHLNNDKKMDIIVGHVEAPSTVFFNDGTGRFKSISFGDAKGTVYGFAVGDFDEDGAVDIAAGRSEATNVLYFGSGKLKN